MKNRALIIGVSSYPSGISNLPAVAHDVQEIAKLLRSSDGSFKDGEVRTLVNTDATRVGIIENLRDVLGDADAGDTIFIYIAGHGHLDQDANFYFIPHDIRPTGVADSAIPLKEIKTMFDQSKSQRVLLWLDFCHSGGILARNLKPREAGEITEIVERTLRITHGHGKVVMCACTANQSAYESAGHGHFTKYLLEGLRGAATNTAGEVTAGSLHDYIDSKIGSAQQRPLFFGEMTGRIVLMHSRSFNGISKKAATAETKLPVDDSGQWVLLGDHFFQAISVRQKSDDEISVVFRSGGAEDDAKIRVLRPQRHRASEPIAFAHRNDGFLVRVKTIESESTSEGASWILTLKPEGTEYGGGIMYDIGISHDGKNYSADEIAELRARRLLLNDPPPPVAERRSSFGGAGMLEHAITGMGTKFPVTGGIFKKFSAGLMSNPAQTMQIARLAAIYALKASQVFEQVTELRLGPLTERTLHVCCCGKRRDEYRNRSATELRIEGDCLLEYKQNGDDEKALV